VFSVSRFAFFYSSHLEYIESAPSSKKQAHHQKIQADSKTGIVHFITAIRTNERETLNSKRETEGGGN